MEDEDGDSDDKCSSLVDVASGGTGVNIVLSEKPVLVSVFS